MGVMSQKLTMAVRVRGRRARREIGFNMMMEVV